MRNVPERKVSLVQIQLVAENIGSEIDIGKSVIIDITNGDAASIVKVFVGENVAALGFVIGVGEVDAGLRGGEFSEMPPLFVA